jgi:hypothetical protein
VDMEFGARRSAMVTDNIVKPFVTTRKTVTFLVNIFPFLYFT